MKKLIFLSALVLAVQSFATGVVGNDQPQSGSIAFTNAQTVPGGRFTNSFAFQYTQRPVLVLSGSAGPYVINSVTTTNFDVTTTSTNNTSVNWTAYLGYARIATGAPVCSANLATNITLPFTYAYPPIITVSASATNANSTVAITAVTTTNFTMLCNASQTNYWSAIGEAYSPGNQTVTY